MVAEVVTGTPNTSRKRKTVGQLVRFVVVGGFCALLDFGTYQGLRALGMEAAPLVDLARAISFIIGTTTAYLLNKRFTFDAARGGVRQVSSFMLLYGTTFLVAVGVNRWMLQLLPDSAWQSTLAWAISQGTATTINFVLLKLVVFAETDKDNADLAPTDSVKDQA